MMIYDSIISLSANDSMHLAWYKDGTVSAGSSDNLANQRTPYAFKLAEGKTLDDLIAISSNDSTHFAWYKDGTVSVGSSDNLANQRTPYAFKLGELSYKIFPPIGIARVGNSPTEYFIGPEKPGVYEAPPKGLKDTNLMIKRQAARFHIFEYVGGKFSRQILHDEITQINWKVHLVNSKANARNADIPPIDGGKEQISGADQGISDSNQESNKIVGHFDERDIYLGSLRTDEKGRLLVFGGFGKTFRTADAKPLMNYLNNRSWTDDVADGPVSATVTIGEETYDALGAWVIVGPPDFAPEIPDQITLYDRLYEYQRENVYSGDEREQLFPIPQFPSFQKDIYPILNAIHLYNKVSYNDEPGYTTQYPAYPPNSAKYSTKSDDTARQNLFNAVGPRATDLPYLAGGAQFTSVQYQILERWKDGKFKEDYDPTQQDPEITSVGLTKAALKNCAGSTFEPGIEAGDALIQDIYMNGDPFRLDYTKVEAGQISRNMAVPWQADFMLCNGCYWTGSIGAWWPAQRPGRVKPISTATTGVAWANGFGNNDFDSMALNWSLLGTVMKEIGGEYIRNQLSTTLDIDAESSISFNDITSGVATKKEVSFDTGFKPVNLDDTNFELEAEIQGPDGSIYFDDDGNKVQSKTFKLNKTLETNKLQFTILVNDANQKDATLKVTCVAKRNTIEVARFSMEDITISYKAR